MNQNQNQKVLRLVRDHTVEQRDLLWFRRHRFATPDQMSTAIASRATKLTNSLGEIA